MLDGHATTKAVKAAPAAPAKKPRGKPVLDVWASMNFDEKLSDWAVSKRKETRAMMDSVYKDLIPHVDATTFPFFMIPKL
jgi:hypothetical protein